MKKLLGIVGAIILTLTAGISLVACGGPADEREQINSSQTQVYVGTFDGAFGKEWIYQVADAFEEYYKDTPFETGKKGVQVMVDMNRAYTGTNLLSTIENNSNDLFFTEVVNYYDFVSQGKIADISDIVTQPFPEIYGEEGNIAGKLSASVNSYLSWNESDGAHYYALPFYEAQGGIMYDADLFEDYNFYFSDGGNGSKWISNSYKTKSLGQDGKTGIIDGKDYSIDDGLPVTYEDFYDLCDRIYQSGCTPLIWSGQYIGNLTYLATSLWADYEGATDMTLNYTFDGTAHHILDTSTMAESEVEINPDDTTGKELAKQAGRYHALTFLEELYANSSWLDGACTNQNLDHISAQYMFLNSKYSSSSNPIAMLIDATWWENEATDSFQRVVNGGGGEEASKLNRNIAMMPLPQATAERAAEKAEGRKNTYVAINDTFSFIRESSTGVRRQLAKLFLQFCYTDEALNIFTSVTNTPMLVNYELKEETKGKMSHYGRTLFEMRSNSDVVFPGSQTPLFMQNQSSLDTRSTWDSRIGGLTYEVPAAYIRDNPHDGVALTYFNGIYSHYNYNWDTYLSRIGA